MDFYPHPSCPFTSNSYHIHVIICERCNNGVNNKMVDYMCYAHRETNNYIIFKYLHTIDINSYTLYNVAHVH